MENQSACVRCGKPCAPGEIMCPECNQWFQEQTRGKSAGLKGNAKPQRPQTPPVRQEAKTPPVTPPVREEPFTTGPVEQTPGGSVPPVRETPAAGQTPRQAPPVRPKKAAGKGKMWIPLVTGGVAALVIVAVVLVLVTKKPKGGTSTPTGTSDNWVDSETNTGGFLPEASLSDDTPAEEPESAEEPAETPEETPEEEPEEEPETEKPSEETAMVACIACGENIPANALFCPYCGESQTEEEAPEEITVSLGSESDIDGSRFSVLPIQSADQSSVVVQSGSHDNTAAAAVDGKLETSWQEGVDGDGIGEWVRFNLGSTRTVQYLRLYLGNWRNYDWYRENNVPKALEIELNGQTWQVEFPYDQEPHVVVFSAPVETDYVVLRVASVYEGSQYDDTCIAEVEIIGY